ncbi:MAG: type II secretion system protein M [Burkholderiales bacterium]|nr:type II secretion system protein M [Burkholderiales bacterium]
MDKLKASWENFWQARTAQEQKVLTIGGIFVAIALIYSVLLGPALEGRVRVEKQMKVLTQQVAQLRELAKEAQALAGRNGPPPAPMNQEMINTALSQRGMKADSVTVVGDQVKLQLSNVQFSGVLGMLDDMQKNARVTVFDANITSLPEAGKINAALTLRQQKSE